MFAYRALVTWQHVLVLVLVFMTIGSDQQEFQALSINVMWYPRNPLAIREVQSWVVACCSLLVYAATYIR